MNIKVDLMKFFAVVFTIILYFSACCSSEAVNDPSEENGLKLYDPDLAGAVIVESFDITDKIAYLETHWIRNYFSMKTNYNLAEYNDLIYIRIRRTLYVFDKVSMQKQREIEINLPQGYDFLPPNSVGFTVGNGFAVTGNQAFILFTDERYPPYKTYLFNINLETGDAHYINEETLGIKFSDRTQVMMGLDQQENAIWFRIENLVRLIYYFHYDSNTNTFTKIDEAIWDNYRVSTSDYIPDIENPRAYIMMSSICGNESWNIYLYAKPRYGERSFFVVDKRNMNSLTERIGHIDVKYLATLSLPQSIIYDKPYVWIMVEREGRIQMLKLLSHG
jgi:hypothetical protein